MNKIINLLAGDKSLEETKKELFELSKTYDLVELSIPFSDPIAQGNTHQEANARALKRFNGSGIPMILKMIQEVKEQIDLPIIVSTYLNPVFKYGFEKFCEECHKMNIDGIHLFDCPYEESKEYIEIANDKNVNIVLTLSYSNIERMKNIIENAKGYLYVIPSKDEKENQEMMAMIDINTNIKIVMKNK